MITTERHKFNDLLLALCETYKADIKIGTANLYWESLKAFNYYFINKAATYHVSDHINGSYFPTINQLKNIILTMPLNEYEISEYGSFVWNSDRFEIR